MLLYLHFLPLADGLYFSGPLLLLAGVVMVMI